MPGKFDLFWTTMELCDWRDEWNDDKVLRPVIRHLSKQDDQIIFAFDDLMAELLYKKKKSGFMILAVQTSW